MSHFCLSSSVRSIYGGTNADRCVNGLGEIHVIVGPMFVGKTTALLRRIKEESNDGRKVAMVKSSKDIRYAIDSVVSYDGIKVQDISAISSLNKFETEHPTLTAQAQKFTV